MKRVGYPVVLAALALWVAVAFARSSGSPASRTGATAIGGVAAEASCAACHNDNTVNTGGSVSVLGAPTLFRAGRTYRLTVHLASTRTSASFPSPAMTFATSIDFSSPPMSSTSPFS